MNRIHIAALAVCLAIPSCALFGGRSSEGPTEIPDRRTSDPEDYVAALRLAYAGGPSRWPAAVVKPGAHVEPLGPLWALGPTPEPADNPSSDAKAELGELLFFDGRLSGTGQMACASCHVAELGWADGRTRSLGHGAGQLARNTPSMLNAAYQDVLFADGRAGSLEELVVAVLTNEHEMNAEPEQVEQSVSAIAAYAPYFAEAFGDETVSIDRIAQAIAVHVRTIVSESSSDFDDVLEGDVDALLSAGGFHNLGLTYYGRKYEDLGRYAITGEADDVGRFRTPSLRNVARTAPYTRTGFFELDGLMNIYNAGGARQKRPDELADDPLWPEPSPLLEPLGLDAAERADLVAFLESLTERRRRDLVPELPQS